jgi:hypothetical protein
MSWESLIYNHDESKIKVVAGDLAPGFWEISGSTLRCVVFEPNLKHDSVNLATSLKRLDVKDMMSQDMSEPLVGAGIGALLGLRFFGLVGAADGAAAGYFFTNPKNQVSATVELKDGRKFIAVMTPQQFQRLHEYAPKRSEHTV